MYYGSFRGGSMGVRGVSRHFRAAPRGFKSFLRVTQEPFEAVIRSFRGASEPGT